MNRKEEINKNCLPRHIAIIMDGNGRWAKERGYNRIFGHQSGVVSVREATEAAAEIGIEYLTLYAFSTENWNRPTEEVDALMELLVDTIEKETPTLLKNNVRLLSIGDMSRLPEKTVQRFKCCIEETASNTGLNLVLAISYSSRWEITNATIQIAQKVASGELNISDISEKTISDNLTTSQIPDPDLLIRTSGEERISNFLLWQLAYTELYFTNINWPDFRKEQLYDAIYAFQNRERRYGKIGEQIRNSVL